MNNMFVHLTNYSVNKANPEFVMPPDINGDYGHKRSWSTVLNRLEREGHNIRLLLS